MEIYSSYGHPRHSSMLVLLLIKITTYQSRAVCLYLQSLPALPVWGQFLISSGKLPGCEPTTMPEEMFDGNCARNQNRSEIFTDSHLQEARKQACKPLFSMRWDKWQKRFAKWVSGMTTHISSHSQGSAHCPWVPYPQCVESVPTARLPASVSLFQA